MTPFNDPEMEELMKIKEPYKKANRKYKAEDTIINIGDIHFGEGNFHVFSGPCSVESKEQITEVANRVKAAGATVLRGGAFKPRTSPYAFQGMAADGIELMLEAKRETDVDILQVGARNMQNFDLLKALGRSKKPILLKRGLANTIEELLMSAEYIMAGGNDNIILCERGIRTFETATRNTLDISAVPVLKKLTHLPVIVDPSHGCGKAELVEPMSLAALAAGADGLIIEVHNDPANALCDGPQSLTPDQFDTLMRDKIRPMSELMGKKLGA